MWRVERVTRRVCDELTGDELTMWQNDRVTSWLVAVDIGNFELNFDFSNIDSNVNMFA